MDPRTADPLDRVRWSRRTVALRDDGGRPVFEGEVLAPAAWSDEAVAVVASRYLRGDPGAVEEDRSVRALIARVGGTLAAWVRDAGLGGPAYPDALLDLLADQRGAFNSPIWFNVGIDDEPQCSACFILSVDDDMRSILDLARREGLIFQRGSGAGSNLSRLRSSRERVTGGGFASGPVSFMRGYDAFAGVIKSGGRTRRAAKMQVLDASHPDVLDFARCKLVEERKARALLAAGFSGGIDGEAYRSVAFQNANLSVRLPDEFLRACDDDAPWTTRAATTGEPLGAFPARELLRTIAEGSWACGDPGVQYETTIRAWHTCPASGRIRASNPCSEYLFLDDTACNLASLNLMRFLREDGGFDVAAFTRDVGLLLRAMEAIVERAGYPTAGIAERSRRFRTLGLGYANLGALLLACGLPYDSDAGRGLAAAITALMTGEAWRVSARMAVESGPFAGFAGNREPCLAVLRRHREALDGIAHAPEGLLAAARASWDDALDLAAAHGVRNAQVTVLAPTGTIAFLMDCDTTGIEPDLSLVKYKRLSGGGTIRMVNRVVPRALARLGYGAEEAARIVRHLEETETIEGAPGLREEHLPVFDCAFRPPGGTRVIAPTGHLAMMAAVQPFLSGGISKTVNLPAETTLEEIEELYLLGGRLGLKALAVYREGSKGVQPLGNHCVVEEGRASCCE